jgi:hypothetical protein
MVKESMMCQWFCPQEFYIWLFPLISCKLEGEKERSRWLSHL